MLILGKLGACGAAYEAINSLEKFFNKVEGVTRPTEPSMDL